MTGFDRHRTVLSALLAALSLAALVAFAVGCTSELEVGLDDAVFALPEDLVDNPDNPMTPSKVELGRLLFWDPILSGDQDVACATCHHPDLAYADGLEVSIGVGGTGIGPDRTGPLASRTPRNSMTVLNTVFNGTANAGATSAQLAPMFWDNRVKSLETQALEPIKNEIEMRGAAYDEESILPEVVRRLRANNDYRDRFLAVFGTADIEAEHIGAAIAAFERSLVVFDSSFDRYMRGDDGALSTQQKRGLAVFVGNGCARCHSGPMFSDFELHDIAIPGASAEERRDGLRTGSLRMVTRTAPYMHNGIFATLADAIEHYDDVDESLDPALVEIEPPDGSDLDDLIAFLESISDGTFDTSVPLVVPSGLPPGGS